MSSQSPSSNGSLPFDANSQSALWFSVSEAHRTDEQAAYFMAAQASIASRRSGVLLTLLSPELIVRLDQRLLADLNITSESLDLLMSPYSREHVASGGSARRRESITANDIRAVLGRVHFYGRRRIASHEFELYGHHASLGLVLVGIKHVAASRSGTARDELWVSTARRIGRDERTVLLRGNRMRPVNWSAV